jgi:hypothetical protein
MLAAWSGHPKERINLVLGLHRHDSGDPAFVR